MEALVAVFGLAALAALGTGIVMVVVNAIRRRRLRVWAITAGSGFLVFVLMMAIMPKSDDTRQGDAARNAIPVIGISIQQLKIEYDANQIVADNKYKGQILEVTGAVVANISRDLFGRPYASLNTGAPFELWSLTCRFRDGAQVLELQRGQTITVKGKNTGMSLGIVGSQDCEVVK